jgi:hypothetical protein
MKGPSELSEMIQLFPNFGFEAIKIFPLWFWRNIARIACLNSRAFR